VNDDYRFNVKRKRPEDIHEKVTDYFNSKTLINYATSKSMMRIQEKITIRALELLDLKNINPLILDAGCGPGFTSIYLKEIGYNVVALDLISEFLYFYKIKEINPICSDMCFLPFKSNIFDAIISISALQWIYKDLKDDSTRNNLINLTKSFECVLKADSKIVIQFYPKNEDIIKGIGKIFINNTNLDGNFVIDNPNNPKKRKIFLLLEKGH